ncbi:hypothetical protein [Candidatus Rickettsia kedanie]|uniref:hypothetical protein n=1 Tax=Candidatus Rickettsia kedanie TaxID=3115352 RepID=UPI00399D3510
MLPTLAGPLPVVPVAPPVPTDGFPPPVPILPPAVSPVPGPLGATTLGPLGVNTPPVTEPLGAFPPVPRLLGPKTPQPVIGVLYPAGLLGVTSYHTRQVKESK